MSSEEFTDEEVRTIMERAARQQQASEARGLKPGGGTSLESLEEIATEVGIDAGYVKAAARELTLKRDAAPAATVLGVARRTDVVRVVPGTVSDEEWGRIVSEVRRMSAATGTVSEFGQVREWVSSHAAPSAGMPIQVRLEPVEGGTLISLGQDTLQAGMMPGVMGGSMMAAVVALMIVMGFNGATGPLVLVTAIFAAIAVAMAGGGLLLGHKYVERQSRKFEAAMDRIELIARTGDDQ